MTFLAIPIALGSFPQRGVVVIGGILRTEPVVIVGRGRNLSAQCQIFRGIMSEECHIPGIVCRHNRQDVAIGIKLHLVDTDLTVEAVYAPWQVVAVIHDIVFPVLLEDGMMSWTMDCLVGIGLKDASFIFKRSHGPRCRRGVLHAIGVIVAGTRGIGEIIDTMTFEDKRRLEDILQFGVGDEPFLREELISGNGKRIVFMPSTGRTSLHVMTPLHYREGLGVGL